MATSELLRSLAGPLFLLVAGLLIAFATRPQRPRDDGDVLTTLLLGLAWGFGLLPAATFFLVYGVLGLSVTLWAVGAVAGICTAAAVGWWWWRGRARLGTLVPATLPDVARRHVVGLGIVAGVVLLYFLRFDYTIFSRDACLLKGSLAAVDRDVAMAWVENLFTRNYEDVRLGNVAVVSSFMAMSEVLGPHMLYALAAGMAAAGAYVLGLQMTGSVVWAAVAQGLLVLNPYVLKIPVLDENLLVLGFVMVLVPALLGRRGPWWALGLVCSLVLGMRHILLLGVPALLWGVWRASGRDVRALLWFAGLALLGTVPYHVHHLLAQGSVFRFESFGQVGSFAHSLGPLEFQWEGMLNWPFHERLVRTPNNPWPTALMWVLWFLDHFGLVLCGAAVVGFVAGWRERRLEWALHAGWFLPVMAMLAVQENWDYLNKMNIALIVFPAPLAWTVWGLARVVARPRWYAPALLAAVLALWGVAVGAARVEAPADDRYAAVFPEFAREPAGYVDHVRDHAGRVALWPGLGRVDDFSPVLTPGRVASLADHLSRPGRHRREVPYAWAGADLPRPGGAVVVALDLSVPPWEGGPLVALADGEPDLDLTQGEAVRALSPVALAWNDVPAVVVATPGVATHPGLQLTFQPAGEALDTNLFLSLMRVPYRLRGEPVMRAPEPSSEGRVLLRVPEGPLTVFTGINQRAVHLLVWKFRVSRDGVERVGRYWFYNN